MEGNDYHQLPCNNLDFESEAARSVFQRRIKHSFDSSSSLQDGGIPSKHARVEPCNGDRENPSRVASPGAVLITFCRYTILASM